MKKKINLIILLIVISISFSSCKKGEDDPFLSLRSRTLRFSGEWKLTDLDILIQESYGGGILQTQYNFNNGVVYAKETQPDTIINYSFIYNIDLIIEKKGTYTKSVYYDSTQPYVVNGNWMWLGRNKEQNLRNKESVAFTVTKEVEGSSVYTYFGKYNMPDNILVLKELSNKKMVVLFDFSTINVDGSIEFEKGTFTYEKQ